ncbi:hypothetical protein ES702_02109 [subsurface metagenome]
MSKAKKAFLAGLIILAIAGLIYVLQGAIYSIIPKYQIYSVRVDDDFDDLYDRVLIIKLNVLTGETNSWYEQYDPNSSKRLKFNF